MKDLEFVTTEDILSLDDWQKQGRPRMWVPVEVKGDWRVDIDHGYGCMRLMNKGTEVGSCGSTSNFISDSQNRVVCLRADYYDLPQYLWFPQASQAEAELQEALTIMEQGTFDEMQEFLKRNQS